MSPTSNVIETCPVCGVDFTASPVRVAGKTPTKTCPGGHTTPVHKLRAIRGPQPDPLENAPAAKREDSGRNAILMLSALLDCYDRLLATLPKQARAMTEGIFGGYVELARKMVR